MRRLAAGAATAALMGILLWSGLRHPGPIDVPDAATIDTTDAAPEARFAGAEERVHALLADARAGDVDAYLAAFTGPLADRLGREVREQGRAAFAAGLRRAALARKGHAVFAPEPDGVDTVRITVETVYPDRNERQNYRLDRQAGDWRVSAVETLRGHAPPAQFGAPARFEAPEGVPVP